MITALIALMLAQADPVAELKTELEALCRRIDVLETERARLRRENEAMRAEVERLQTFCIEAANRLVALRLDGPGPTLLRARILATSSDHEFVVVDKGGRDGFGEGWTGDVLRAEADGRFSRLGAVRFGKSIETAGHRQAKLLVTEGTAAVMKAGDQVVDNRFGDPKAALERPLALDVPAPAAAEPVYRITGCTDEVWFVDCGRAQGLKSGAVISVMRRGEAVARLKLGKVGDGWAEATLEPGSEAPLIGDLLRLREPPKAIVGRVKHNTAEHGICLDFGTDTGAAVGMVFEIKRQGKPAGRLRVTTALKGVAFAESVGALRREEVQVGDFVEWLPDSRH